MSIRSTPSTSRASTLASKDPIDFKPEFANSAALAASHDESVSSILQRLDQLQAKINNQSDDNTTRAAPLRSGDDSIHSRLQYLEKIHEDSLHSLSSKLALVEQRFRDNAQSEELMSQIVSKFSTLESKIKGHAEVDSRLNEIASRFQRIESKIRGQVEVDSKMEDIASKFQRIESKLRGQMDVDSKMDEIASRFQRIESKIQNAMRTEDRISKLEAHLTPDPEQERILARINSKLDMIEQNRRSAPESHRSAPTMIESRHESEADRIKYLEARIEKLKLMREKYSAE